MLKVISIHRYRKLPQFKLSHIKRGIYFYNSKQELVEIIDATDKQYTLINRYTGLKIQVNNDYVHIDWKLAPNPTKLNNLLYDYEY